MPLPLFWLGAGAVAIFTGTYYSREQQKSRGYIHHFPGDCEIAVTPKNGSVVCCGIYEVFQHSGIWLDGQIIELRGNGLIRAISPERFLSNRTGQRIYVACDQLRTPMVDPATADRALARVFEYAEYDVINNNCHRFTLQCVTGYDHDVTRFSTFNASLQRHFGSSVFWQPIEI